MSVLGSSVVSSLKALSGKKIVITGGLGFIGSTLAVRLCRDMNSLRTGTTNAITLVDSLIPEYGGNIFNIDPCNDYVTVSTADVRNTESLKPILEGADILFNLAGQTSHLDSMKHPVTDLEINAAAQLSILELCRQVCPNVRIVFASTRQIYGRPRYLPVDELHPIAPVDVNGINKTAGEQYHLLYHTTYNIPATVLRLTNTYGPRMRIKDARQTFLGIWVKNLLMNKEISVFGDGSQRRDFNYVEDVVDALILAATSDNTIGEVYNLGDENHYSLLEVAKMLSHLHPAGSFDCHPFPLDLKTIDIGDYYGNFDKFKIATGWTPQTPLSDGLRSTVEYYHEYLSHYI